MKRHQITAVQALFALNSNALLIVTPVSAAEKAYGASGSVTFGGSGLGGVVVDGGAHLSGF